MFVISSVLQRTFIRKFRLFIATCSTNSAVSYCPAKDDTGVKFMEVLQLLNTADQDELQKYKISKKYIAKILDHRESHGHFLSLSELITLTGLSFEKLQKIRKLFINSNIGQITEAQKLVTSPSLSAKKCRDIQSIVSLDVSLHFLTLAHLNTDMSLHSWCRIPVSKKICNYNLHTCYEQAVCLASKIPEADIYLMEQKHTQSKSVNHVSVLLNQAILQTYILAELNLRPRKIVPTKLNIVTIRSSSLTKFFRLQIGNERTTGQDLVLKILKGDAISFLTSLPKLKVSQELQTLYKDSSSIDKEYLCNNLLLCLAFYENIFKSS